MNRNPIQGRPRVAITATVSLLLAIVAHIRATVEGLTSPYFIPASHWACLTVSEAVLLIVVTSKPMEFHLRKFRLPGILVISISLVLLAPLAGVVRLYGDQVPRLMVLALAAGVFATALVFAAIPGRPTQEVAQLRRESEGGIVFIITFVAVAVFPIWLRSLPSIPILDLLRGGQSNIDLAVARDEAFLGLASVPLRVIVAVIRNIYLMFAIGWLVADWITTPRSEWRLRSQRQLTATVAVAVAAAYALVTTERAILGQVAVVVVISALVALRKPLTARMVTIVLPIALAFPLFFGFVVTSGDGGAALESVRRRIFFLPSDVMVHYFTAFPAQHGFLHGRSVPKVPRLFGVPTFDLSGFIYDSYYRVDASLHGIANGAYLGVGWANFGFGGVVIWAVAAAGAVVALDRLVDQLPRRTGAALRAVAVIQVALLTSVDVSRTVLGIAPGLLDLVLLAWVLTRLDRRRTYHATAVNSERDHSIQPARPAGV